MGASREHRHRLYKQLVGTTIAGRFKITNLLGFGGMGAVYEAVQRNMQRSIALKVIPSHDPTTTARFEREALTISQLHHPNTVTVFDYGKTDQGVLFLAMEMLSGQTLSDLIKARGVLTPNEAVHIATQVCRSLSEAHRANIVHRDIKPDNIFLIRVDEDPNFVKVLDFGIAKILKGEDDVNLTGVDRIIGTPKYMSPEQILAETVDHRSDIYSLGCIVFEMLCGTPPFQDSNTTKLMIAHAQQPPPTFAERLPNDALNRVPGPLEAVVRRSLAKSPAQRYRDIDEFRDALQTALDATDHHLRVSELADSTQIQPAAPINRELTDSGDMLSQYSSQSLNRLRPLTDVHAAPINPSQDLSGSRVQPAPAQTPNASTHKGPVYAIVAALLLLGALGAYVALKPAAEKQPDPQNSAPAAPAARAADAPENQPATPKQAPQPAGKSPIKVSVRVLSEPAGARVYEEGRSVGRTPMTIHGEDGMTLNYSFEKDGYLAKKASYVLDSAVAEPVFSVNLEQEAAPKTKPAPRRRPRPSRPAKTRPKKEEPSQPTQEEPPREEPKPVRPLVPKLDDENGPTTVPLL